VGTTQSKWMGGVRILVSERGNHGGEGAEPKKNGAVGSEHIETHLGKSICSKPKTCRRAWLILEDAAEKRKKPTWCATSCLSLDPARGVGSLQVVP